MTWNKNSSRDRLHVFYRYRYVHIFRLSFVMNLKWMWRIIWDKSNLYNWSELNCHPLFYHFYLNNVFIIIFCSVFKGTMRNWTVPFPGQVWRLRLGSDPGNCHHRQTTEAYQRRLRQLRNKVSLVLRKTPFCAKQSDWWIILRTLIFSNLR